jgi:hypothetical protein
MCRGPGRVERAILDHLQREPDGASTVEDLARSIYGEPVAEKRLAAILRTIRSLVRRNRTMLSF